MMDVKAFPLTAVLSVATGRLVSPFGPASTLQLLDWMTGRRPEPWRIAQASRDCRAALLAQHPGLAAIPVPDWADDLQVTTWVFDQAARFGLSLPVERIDPRRIVPVQAGSAAA